MSTFAVASTATVGALKALMATAAIMDELEGATSARGLLYKGVPLRDDATLEECGVADRSCLQEVWVVPSSKEAIAKANDETLAAVEEQGQNYATQADALRARVKHYKPKRPDNDYSEPSWHTDYEPYAQYVPPRDGAAQIQAPAYAPGGPQAWRNDPYL